MLLSHGSIILSSSEQHLSRLAVRVLVQDLLESALPSIIFLLPTPEAASRARLEDRLAFRPGTIHVFLLLFNLILLFLMVLEALKLLVVMARLHLLSGHILEHQYILVCKMLHYVS